jgi:hypothetical protein
MVRYDRSDHDTLLSAFSPQRLADSQIAAVKPSEKHNDETSGTSAFLSPPTIFCAAVFWLS